MGVPGRIVCRACGENNFSTQSACWKCGKALTAPVTAAPAPASDTPAAVYAPAPAYTSTSSAPMIAAAAMGLLFPAIAIPVGIVFLMLDDRRKASVGWANILWGIGGSVLHVIVTGLLMTPLMTFAFKKQMEMLGGMGQGVEQRLQNQQINNLNNPLNAP